MCVAGVAVDSSFQGLWAWRADWIFGMLLIFFTVIVHVTGLGLMHQQAVHVFVKIKKGRSYGAKHVLVIGAVTMMATCLHVLELIIWAACYRFLDAIPDTRSAMLYSINAMTSYGHESVFLDRHWQLLGAAEALNGWLLFGLTTAFLFAMFQKALLTTETPPVR